MSTTPLTQPHLRVIAACAKTLSTDAPFHTRIEQVYSLLRGVMAIDDMQLTYWADFPTHEGLIHLASGAWDIPWDTQLIRSCLEGQRALNRDASHPLKAAPGEFAMRLYTTHCIPISANGEVYGVFAYRVDTAKPPSTRDIATVDALIPLLATQLVLLVATTPQSVHDERLLQAARRQLRIPEVLTQLRGELEPPIPLHSLLPLILQRAIDYTGAELGSIMLVDHDRHELELSAVHGYTVTPLVSGSVTHIRHRWSWDSGIAGKVARSGRPLMLTDSTGDVDYFFTDPPRLRAKLAIPITVDGRSEAVICLDSLRADAFDEHASALALGIAETATPPLLRALRYQELLDRSTQFGQVFQTVPSGLLLTDNYGQVLRHNPAFEHIWGLNPGQVGPGFRIPFDMLALCLPRFIDSNAFTQFCDQAHQHPERELSIQIKLRNPHQELSLVTRPTRDNSEHITGRVWAVTDTTRETAADRIKSEFTSLMSHELKTPLTSIMGYSELLLNRDLPPDAQKNLIRILRSEAEHLQQLVNEMLDVARIEANTIRITRWPIDVAHVSVELVKSLTHSVTFANHQVSYDIQDALPPAYADKERVRQVLTNLLSNAAKYSPNGGTITLRIRELTQPPPKHPDGAYIHVSVSDEGMGITAENLARVWDRFVRLDTSNTKSIGGTGLGLTIVRGLVELQGGRAWANSEINKGSTFHFTLPVASDLAQDG